MFMARMPAITLGLLATIALPAAPRGEQHAAEADQIVTTQHQVSVGSRTLKYTARAGLLPIHDNETGDVHARMFFVAYTLDRAEGQAQRPLTFVWNGGPGMNSSLIHLLGFGPKRVKTGDVYPTSPPLSETELVDNEDTWLDWTDLVFVDPVGTGYSRPTKAEYAGEFYHTAGDAEAVSEFVRVYRLRFDAWDAPLFIVGHSYGTTRAMAMSEILVRRGIDVTGVSLLSGGFSIGQAPLPPGFDTALTVPGMTAAAFFHKKLAPDLQRDLAVTLKKAESWAQNDYAPALARRDTLGDRERVAVVEGLSRYTGLAVSALDRATLVVDGNQFRTQLVPGMSLGRYDSRMSRTGTIGREVLDVVTDPSFAPVLGLVQGTSPLLNRYMRNQLQFKSDLLYQGPLGGGYPPTQMIMLRFVRDQASATEQPPLRRAMDANPHLRVFVGRGLYDSGSCFTHAYHVSHLEPGLARRVTMACYGAGHDFYSDKAVRQQIKRDMASFVQRTLTDKPGAEHEFVCTHCPAAEQLWFGAKATTR
jgi:carboxypeptidase C (cathepsin A)